MAEKQSNSMNFLYVTEWFGPQRASCPLLCGVELPHDPDRYIFIGSSNRLKLYKTDTRDFTDEEIRSIKFVTGQIYLDKTGKTNNLDFRRDMVKLNLSEKCSGCDRKEYCPGLFMPCGDAVYDESERPVIDALKELNGRVLDVGCGSGFYDDILKKLIDKGVIDYLGIDPEISESRLSAGLRTEKTTIEEFEDEDESYDHILVLRSHNHFRDERLAYDKMERLLKPGGYLLVVDNTKYAMVRQPGYKESVAGNDAPSQHYRNDTSFELLDKVKDRHLSVEQHYPVRADGFNQWVLSFKKNTTEHVDVLIINPPVRLKKDFVDYPYYTNIGVLQNAAHLKETGYRVALIDSFSLPDGELTEIEDDFLRLGSGIERIGKEIERYSADVIFVARNPFNYDSKGNDLITELVKMIRKKALDTPLLYADFYVGGMHYIEEEDEDILRLYPEFDGLLRYECEKILPEAIESIKEKGIKKVKVWHGDAGQVDLDETVFPDWDMIHYEQHQRITEHFFKKLNRTKHFSIIRNTFPLMTGRSCPYSCVFCTHDPGQGERRTSNYRTYDLKRIEEHINRLKTAHYAKKLIILDEIANAKESHFEGLLEILEKSGLKYDFPNGLRADRLKKEHILKMSGSIDTLSVSAESGSQVIIDNVIGKNQNLESIENVAKWCSDAGVRLIIHYMIGLPGETGKDINITLGHALKMHSEYGAIPSVQFINPIPGTHLYNSLPEQKRVGIKNNRDIMSHFFDEPISCSDVPSSDLVKFKDSFEMGKRVGRTEKVIINLTYECNNRCRFCAIGLRERNTLSIETVKKFLVDYREKGVRLVDFDGGEPTLHENLPAIIRIAQKLGYEKINVTSNGRKLSSRPYVSRLLLSGITDLLISIHGHTEEIHEAHTTKKGSFHETYQGIKNVLRLKPERIDFGLNITVTKINGPRLYEFAEHFAGLGIKKINVQFITPFGSIDRDIVPDPEEVTPQLRKTIDGFSDKIQINVVNLPFCFMPGYERFLVSDIEKKCRNMVFVTEEDVNLSEFLSGGRKRTEECEDCLYSILCDGKYHFDIIGF